MFGTSYWLKGGPVVSIWKDDLIPTSKMRDIDRIRKLSTTNVPIKLL